MPESVHRIDPMTLTEIPPFLADIVAELSSESERLKNSLHPRTAASLAALVRIMNAYYSNLIEGNNTRPRDIARALAGDFDGDEERRNLALEAAAHVRVQAEIDRLAAANELQEPAAAQFVSWVHKVFYDDAPEAYLHVRKNDPAFAMVPGAWRSQPSDDVVVGRHQPPSSAAVQPFMRYFETNYRFANLGKAQRIIATAAAHHRLNYIHPFPDGNGRVSRLMSHAMAHEAGIGAHGLWSISRGLARGLNDRSEYLRMMDATDAPRDSQLDGRGNLSLRALIEFVTWFVQVSLDQVRFMADSLEFPTLKRRIRAYVDREDRLRPEVAALLEEAIVRGEFDRGEAARITGLPERTARRTVAESIRFGLLASDTVKGKLSMRFSPDSPNGYFRGFSK